MEKAFRDESSSIQWCDALNWLIEEHRRMRILINELVDPLKQIGKHTSGINPAEIVDQLSDKINEIIRLEREHADKEEQILFPVLAPYIELNMGMISMIELEHEQVRHNLDHFFSRREESLANTDTDEIKITASYLVNALLMLDEHLTREEQHLFPLAQERLSEEEKEIIYRGFINE